MDRKNLLHKYGKFRGLDKVYSEFDPVNNPVLNPSILLKHRAQKKSEQRRNPSLPSLGRNSKSSQGNTMSSIKSKRGLWMSQKLNGKNFRTRDVNTKLKLDSVYRRFNKMNLESDKYFYPNPEQLIHPLKDTRKLISSSKYSQSGPIIAQSELVAHGNLYAPETTRSRRKFRVKRTSNAGRRSLSQNSKGSVDNNLALTMSPYAASKLNSFIESKNGDLIRDDQFDSIYDTSYNDNQPEFKPPKATMKLDNVKDMSDIQEIKSPFSYEEVVSRIHGYSRGTHGQPFRP